MRKAGGSTSSSGRSSTREADPQRSASPHRKQE
jgi:hypothetical protein